MRAQAPSSRLLRVSYTMSDSISRIRREKEICPSATRGRPAAPLLNLLAAIIIYWNTRKLGEAVFTRKNAGLDVPAEFLAHVSPLGWEHINLTGEYRWPGAGPRST